MMAALTGDMALPSGEQMDSDIEKDFVWRTKVNSMPARYAHKMGSMQWAYNDDLAELAQFRPVPTVVPMLYDEVHSVRTVNLPGYKNFMYRLINDTDFEEVR